MFTGIIEALGHVEKLEREKENLHITVSNKFPGELKIDQSVAHNGVCLTIVELSDEQYTVTAIQETLLKSNLGSLKTGDVLNVERCMTMNGRLDGHIVQGHVDKKGTVKEIKESEGSWYYHIEHKVDKELYTVPKGSITINGVSLTVVDSKPNGFSVAIIPYTYEHTNFHTLKVGDEVNLEFDILGKYVARYMANFK